MLRVRLPSVTPFLTFQITHVKTAFELATKKFVGLEERVGSSNSAYRGEGLDSHLKILGQYRLPGESDWDFRKRVFPKIFQRDRYWAFEILVGKEPHRWGSKLEDLLQQLGKNPSVEELAEFASRWGEASRV